MSRTVLKERVFTPTGHSLGSFSAVDLEPFDMTYIESDEPQEQQQQGGQKGSKKRVPDPVDNDRLQPENNGEDNKNQDGGTDPFSNGGDNDNKKDDSVPDSWDPNGNDIDDEEQYNNPNRQDNQETQQGGQTSQGSGGESQQQSDSQDSDSDTQDGQQQQGGQQGDSQGGQQSNPEGESPNPEDYESIRDKAEDISNDIDSQVDNDEIKNEKDLQNAVDKAIDDVAEELSKETGLSKDTIKDIINDELKDYIEDMKDEIRNKSENSSDSDSDSDGDEDSDSDSDSDSNKKSGKDSKQSSSSSTPKGGTEDGGGNNSSMRKGLEKLFDDDEEEDDEPSEKSELEKAIEKANNSRSTAEKQKEDDDKKFEEETRQTRQNKSQSEIREEEKQTSGMIRDAIGEAKKELAERKQKGEIKDDEDSEMDTLFRTGASKITNVGNGKMAQDWRSKLERILSMASGVKITMNPNLINKRIENAPPGREDIVPEISNMAILVDMSGSMGAQQFKQVILHIDTILKAKKLGHVKFHILGWGSSSWQNVAATYTKCKGKDLKRTMISKFSDASGGTCLVPGIQVAAKLLKKPDAIMIFTDAGLADTDQVASDPICQRFMKKHKKRLIWVLTHNADMGKFKRADPYAYSHDMYVKFKNTKS